MSDNEATVVEDLGKLGELCRRRGETYGLLARFYRSEADAGFIERLRGMRFPATTGNDALDRGYRLVASYLSRPDDGMLLELAVDYTRTFIGAGVDGHAAAYPFESVYTSEERLLRQDARDEVLALYRAEGLNKSAAWRDEEDHAGVEMEFLAVLCDRAADALEAGDGDGAAALLRAQHFFLLRHPLRWMLQLAKDMRIFARTDFYRGLAELTDGFLAVDRGFLDELLAEDEGGETGRTGDA